MYFGVVLESISVLGVLWGHWTSAPVCSARPAATFPQVYGAAPLGRAPSARVTAFVDVNVVPMDTDRVLRHQTVLVEGGQIVALGPVNTVPVPTEAVRVDGRGKYLMPGLTDMHAHLTMGSKLDDQRAHLLLSYLANGVTGVRQDVAEKFLQFRSGDALSPRLYLPPHMSEISVYLGRIMLRTIDATRVTGPEPRLDSIAGYVANYKAVGYDYLAIPATYTEERAELRTIYDSVVVAARRLGLPVASHTNTETYEQMLAYGAYGGSVEHLYAFRSLLLRPDSAVPTKDLQEAAVATRRAGTWITPTMVCVEERRGGGAAMDIKLARRFLTILHDAGVGLLLGADAEGKSPSEVHEELALLVRAGLTPYHALVTGTRNVAQYFGILDVSGTVAVGKRADLVLLYGNPLADVRHAREPAGVMIQGRWLDRAELDARLLTAPKEWFRLAMSFSTITPPRTEAQRQQQKQVRARQQEVALLLDSLTTVPPELAKGSRYVGLLERIAAGLGKVRASLTPEQRLTFDPKAREWLRAQARQGSPIAIPGITPVR